MANYLLTNKAVEDLSKVWDYTFEVWSETQADSYYYMLIDACQELTPNLLHWLPRSADPRPRR